MLATWKKSATNTCHVSQKLYVYLSSHVTGGWGTCVSYMREDHLASDRPKIGQIVVGYGSCAIMNVKRRLWSFDNVFLQ